MEVIYVPGTFDMWHEGHVKLFSFVNNKFPRDYTIAGVSTDKLVMSYKKIAPVYTLKERLSIVKYCKDIDKVIIQYKFFSVEQLKKYNITYVVLGSDWKNKPFPELENAQKKLNFKIIYKPYTKTVSSSEIKKRIIKNAYEIIKAQSKRKLC